ncbi:MAG: hypothetical protein ACKV2Q_12455 [Planctomycetaceae bacterium]
MLGNKTLIEVRAEISKRLKEAGIDEEQFRAELRQVGSVKRKKPMTVESMLETAGSTKRKKRRRAVSKTH